MTASDFTLVYGPQGEPIIVPNADAPQFRATKPDSAVAAGTDRDSIEEFATAGPQGEPIPGADGICPLCGQAFPESES